MEAAVRLRRATEADVAPLLALINGYADRDMLLRRSEESLRACLDDFWVAEEDGVVVGCGALTALGPGLGEVRSLAVREDRSGRGLGRQIVERLLEEAADRELVEVLALTRRVPFFEALGFHVTRRERFLDKLMVDCKACPLNLCCDETAMVRTPPERRNELNAEAAEARREGTETHLEGALAKPGTSS
jgi:amino-acid N-acetyltransferase